jgi:molybdopterin-containing oxidoreductase family membrane subunit
VWVVWLVALVVGVGMWTERFVLVDVSLMRGFMVSKWEMYLPTLVDWGILFGTIAFFSLLFLAFLRFVPFVPAYEVKELVHELEAEGEA